MNHTHKEVSDLRERMAKIKDKLPPDWKTQLATAYPEFNSIQWANHLQNAYFGKCAPNRSLMDALEKMEWDIK